MAKQLFHTVVWKYIIGKLATRCTVRGVQYCHVPTQSNWTDRIDMLAVDIRAYVICTQEVEVIGRRNMSSCAYHGCLGSAKPLIVVTVTEVEDCENKHAAQDTVLVVGVRDLNGTKY